MKRKIMQTNRMISNIKKHPLWILLIFFATVVIGLSNFTDAVKNLLNLMTKSTTPLGPQLDHLLGEKNWFVYPDDSVNQIGVTRFPSGLKIVSPIQIVETDDGLFKVGDTVSRGIGANVTLNRPWRESDIPPRQLAYLQEWRRAQQEDRIGITRKRMNNIFGNDKWIKDPTFPFSASGKIDNALKVIFPITSVDVRNLKYGIGSKPINAGQQVRIWVAGDIPEPCSEEVVEGALRK